VLLDDVIVPTDFLEEAAGTLVTVPGTGTEFWVGLTRPRQDGADWSLAIYDRGPGGAGQIVPLGDTATTGGLQWTFAAATALPALSAVPGIPGDNENALVVLSETNTGTPYLTVLGPVDGRALTLYPDEPARAGGWEYQFEGRREFAGIEVRRDPGAKFIWVAAGLLLLGLGLSLYVPRLRLWARVRGEEAVLAGLAERSGPFRAEANRLARELQDDGGRSTGA
jgi:hypothetical protein